MISITTKELEIENELKRKIEFICDFCNTKPTIINGNIRNIDKSNLSYIYPIVLCILWLLYQLSINSNIANLALLNVS